MATQLSAPIVNDILTLDGEDYPVQALFLPFPRGIVESDGLFLFIDLDEKTGEWSLSTQDASNVDEGAMLEKLEARLAAQGSAP